MIEDTTNKIILTQDESLGNKPKWISRTFGKMEADSIRSSIFLMIAGTIGAGIYTLHHLLDDIGIVWSFFILVFACISSIVALDMYIHASKVTGDPDSYTEINVQILGKIFNYFSTFFNLMLFYLIMISFTVCISKVTFEVLKGSIAESIELNIDESFATNYHRLSCLVVAIFGFILMIPEKADKLSKISLYCFLIHLYIIIITILQAYSFYNDFEEEEKAEFNLFGFDLHGFFYNFGLVISSFNNVPNFLVIRNLVKNPSESRLNKIFRRSNAMILLVYLLTALCGYLSVGPANTENVDLMIFREPLGDTDYLMNIGQGLLGISLLISYSLVGFMLKTLIITLLPQKNKITHIIVAAILVVSASSIAISISSVSNYINLLGCLCGTFLNIVSPALLALKSGYTKRKAVKLGIKLWLLIGSTSGAIGTYYAMHKIIKS